ncbi:unnamed protein product [Prunus armeniaca]|uniref:Uncharacterized protein n=1 Tax=Prunus armeniaca TaxID=36596 RepID=A0A6J5WVT3_PRUAR|nr:unnamed protein product [Prunus armeniaca]
MAEHSRFSGSRRAFPNPQVGKLEVALTLECLRPLVKLAWSLPFGKGPSWAWAAKLRKNKNFGVWPLGHVGKEKVFEVLPLPSIVVDRYPSKITSPLLFGKGVLGRILGELLARSSQRIGKLGGSLPKLVNLLLHSYLSARRFGRRFRSSPASARLGSARGRVLKVRVGVSLRGVREVQQGAKHKPTDW